MAKNKITDLRNHLFETIEMLKDAEKPMDIDRAKAIAAVAQTIIETAKVEVKFLEMTGQDSRSEFMAPALPPASPAANGKNSPQSPPRAPSPALAPGPAQAPKVGRAERLS